MRLAFFLASLHFGLSQHLPRIAPLPLIATAGWKNRLSTPQFLPKIIILSESTLYHRNICSNGSDLLLRVCKRLFPPSWRNSFPKPFPIVCQNLSIISSTYVPTDENWLQCIIPKTNGRTTHLNQTLIDKLFIVWPKRFVLSCTGRVGILYIGSMEGLNFEGIKAIFLIFKAFRMPTMHNELYSMGREVQLLDSLLFAKIVLEFAVYLKLSSPAFLPAVTQLFFSLFSLCSSALALRCHGARVHQSCLLTPLSRSISTRYLCMQVELELQLVRAHLYVPRTYGKVVYDHWYQQIYVPPELLLLLWCPSCSVRFAKILFSPVH